MLIGDVVIQAHKLLGVMRALVAKWELSLNNSLGSICLMSTTIPYVCLIFCTFASLYDKQKDLSQRSTGNDYPKQSPQLLCCTRAL
jgi:hypothetical protein